MWRFYDSSGRQKFNTSPVISLVTSLPSSPNDGDECILTDSLTAGTYQWHLRYVSARSSNKWVFIGGSPAYHFITTNESTGSTTATDLATVGPTFTTPVAGDYLCRYGATVTAQGGALHMHTYLSVDGVASTVTDAETTPAADTYWAAPAQEYRAAGVGASKVIKLQYAVGSNTGHWLNRHLTVTPIALGG